MKRENICRIKFILFAVLTFALISFGMYSVQAQQAGEIVEVTWAGENTKAKIDSCRSDSCYLYLYDASSGKWSEGTAFFRKDQIRGIKIGTNSRQDDTDKSRQKGVSTNNTQQPADNAKPKAQPQPSAANGQLKQLKYKVGQRVEYVDNGKWYKAIITEVRDDSADHLDGKIYAPYRVHPIGYNGYEDKWVCCADFTDFRSQLRLAGSGPTEPVRGGEANDDVLKRMRGATAAIPTQPGSGGKVPAKQYHCVYFVGNQLVDAAPLTITGNSTYTGGTYSFNSVSSTLTFRGGDFDGQRAEYETSGGQPRLHILGKSGRRVIECD